MLFPLTHSTPHPTQPWWPSPICLHPGHLPAVGEVVETHKQQHATPQGVCSLVWDGRCNVEVITLPLPMQQHTVSLQPDNSSETHVQFLTSVWLQTAGQTIPHQSLAGCPQGHRFAHTCALSFPSSPAGEGRCVYRRQAKHLRLKQS